MDTLEIFLYPQGWLYTVEHELNKGQSILLYCLYVPMSNDIVSSLCSTGDAACSHCNEILQLGAFCWSRQNLHNRHPNIWRWFGIFFCDLTHGFMAYKQCYINYHLYFTFRNNTGRYTFNHAECAIHVYYYVTVHRSCPYTRYMTLKRPL